MLLLVMNSEGQDRFDLAKQLLVGIGNQISDICMNGCPESFCFFNGWSRDQSTQIAAMHRAGGVVVRIEKISVFRDGIAVTRDPFFQDEGLEKPRGVGEMPFGRAYVRYRLHNTIFCREIFRQFGGEIPHLAKPGKKFLGWRRLRLRTLLRGRRSICCCDRGLDQVIPPSCSSSSLRASSI